MCGHQVRAKRQLPRYGEAKNSEKLPGASLKAGNCLAKSPKCEPLDRSAALPQDDSFEFATEGLLTNGEVKATWLILPVVIRSSQRLSHACLSITILL
jgi:hypothetical protein